MKISNRKHYAVITGDIVKSSRMSLSQRRWLASELKRASIAVRRVFGTIVPLPLDQFRGDGWQILVSQPARSLRVGLFLRAWLMAEAPDPLHLDTRMAIGVGGVSLLPGSRVSGGDGEAFRRSGRALDRLREPRRLALVWPDTSVPAAEALTVLAPVLDALAQDWTAVQARALVGRLSGLTQERIVRGWPEAVTRQAIARILARAHWPAVRSVLDWLEKSNLQRLQS
ncbi:MAG: hypothetical protein KBA71_10600 [Opitutaceae bacterium]|nr:hypothetical protein [Opitutaceae bacterium]